LAAKNICLYQLVYLQALASLDLSILPFVFLIMIATIYTMSNCPWCVKAKRLLDLKKVEYREINGKSNKWQTVPYIEIDEQPVGGFIELASFFRGKAR